jgi:hypothetical protein
MSEDYMKQLKEMGDQIERLANKVANLEVMFGARLENIELRNKRLEKEHNKLIVKMYDGDNNDIEEPDAYDEYGRAIKYVDDGRGNV